MYACTHLGCTCAELVLVVLTAIISPLQPSPKPFACAYLLVALPQTDFALFDNYCQHMTAGMYTCECSQFKHCSGCKPLTDPHCPAMSSQRAFTWASKCRRGNGKGRARGRSGRNHPSKRLTRDDDDSDAISGDTCHALPWCTANVTSQTHVIVCEATLLGTPVYHEASC